ncbi:hypothetical protein J1N09_11290 [Aureitalea sp. L0-47]|uniref:hypothetical protein n=1 Tax=Aureitalea sp. L0-47 TaxID=2816962 RepID=UPI002237808B|nr:hypothetical protein [Aureitalea sp. L0-47]MCW5520428.1 hypothetical protein [Aureitalea sp. L0-47]
MLSILPKSEPVIVTPLSQSPRKILDTELGKIFIYDNLVIMEGKSEVVMTIKTGMSILLDVVKAVGLRPVVYISNRVNSYAVDPNDYKYLEMIPHLKGIAIVSHNDYGYRTAKLEEKFFRKPFKVFKDLEQAKQWADYVVKGRIIV